MRHSVKLYCVSCSGPWERWGGQGVHRERRWERSEPLLQESPPAVQQPAPVVGPPHPTTCSKANTTQTLRMLRRNYRKIYSQVSAVDFCCRSSQFHCLIVKCLFVTSKLIRRVVTPGLRLTRATFRPSGLHFFAPAVPLSIYSLLYCYLCLISFLLFPCRSVWVNTRAWVTHFL